MQIQKLANCGSGRNAEPTAIQESSLSNRDDVDETNNKTIDARAVDLACDFTAMHFNCDLLDAAALNLSDSLKGRFIILQYVLRIKSSNHITSHCYFLPLFPSELIAR